MMISKLISSVVLAIFGIGATPNLTEQQVNQGVVIPAIVQETKTDLVEIKQEVEKEEIAFTQEKQNDPTLLKGETKIQQEGHVGIREKTYTVTYTNGEETNRELVTNEITQQPIDEIELIGTKSPVVISPKSSGSGYINVDGDFIKSPGSDPSGASAKCRDGTYSYSANRRGTCSGHGGVAQWL
jgi:hypothetical protein